MSLRNLTAFLLLGFMALYGAVETAVCATAPVLMSGAAGEAGACPPEMKMCPMHAGQACCCMAAEAGTAEAAGEADEGVAAFGAGCVGIPASPPVTHPVTPLFRFLMPETAAMETPDEPVMWISFLHEPVSDAGAAPLTPPPQRLSS